MPYIADLGFAVQPGDVLGETPDGAHRPGWIVALAPTISLVEQAIAEAADYIEFVVEDA